MLKLNIFGQFTMLKERENIMRTLIGCIALTLIVGICSVGTTGCGSSSGGGGGGGTRAAYIYTSDLATATAYQTYFVANGWQMDLVKLSDLPATSLASDALIVVSTDSTWTATDSAKVKAAAKPVLGISDGGAHLFDTSAFGLDIGWGNCAGGAVGSVKVNDVSFFTGISGATLGSIVQVVTSGTTGVQEVYNPNATHATLAAINATDLNYSVVATQGTNALWSLNAAPSDLTTQGKALLWNVVKKLVP